MKLINKHSLFLFNLMLIASLCFGSQYGVSAQSLTQGESEVTTPPLYPDLTWTHFGTVQKDVHVYDQVLSLSGEMYESVESFQKEIPDGVFKYYSTENLSSLGWNVVGGASFESTYWHSSGRYLTVKIMDCADSQTDYCVSVWLSTDAGYALPVAQPSAASVQPLVAFNKTYPTNGSVISVPASTHQLLQWTDALIASTDRYQYCIDETNNQSCDDSNWLVRNSLYSGPDFTVLAGHTYYWQVRVRDAGTYANGGTWWSFSVQATSNAPVVYSIVRGNPTSSTTSTAGVSFTVTFNQSVTGVDVSDFVLSAAGVAGAGVSSVTGSGATYTVTVSTGTGDGIIRLDVLDNDSIINSVGTQLGGAGTGNGNFTSGQSYVIDRTPPTVLSSVPATTATAGLVNFTVTFSEVVTGVDINDFGLATTGNVTGALITGVGGSGTTRVVTVNTGGVGSGTIRLNVIDNDSILDAALISLGGSGAGNGNFSTGTLYNKPTFADMPASHWAWKYVEGIYTAGVTSGCGTGLYCTDQPVTRAQMAIFLLKSKFGAAYTPPAIVASTGFNDVATNYWAAAWIKALADTGITSGCGNGNYCPDASVTRAQMAVFLLKAKNGSSYTPPAIGDITGFNDVAMDYWAAAWIKALAATGITSGCSASNYCPEANVTRAEMAVFLVKTFAIPTP